MWKLLYYVLAPVSSIYVFRGYFKRSFKYLRFQYKFWLYYAWTICWCIILLPFFLFQQKKKEILEMERLSNVWKAASKCIIVSKKAMMYILPSGLCMYWCGSIFIDRKNPKDAYNKLEISAAKAFKNKTKIFIFPEGTRNSDLTKFLPFKKGAFALAISSQVPIIPVVFSPYYSINSEKLIFNKGNMIIQCLEPVSTEGLTMEDLPELIERVQTNMSRPYKELLAEVKASLPQDYPVTLPEVKTDEIL